MVKIGTDAKFEAAHRQLNDTGKCGYLHGHNWKVEFEINAPISSLNECGYIIDYKRLKDVVNTLDHTVVLNDSDPLGDILISNNQRVVLINCEPTCENISGFILHEVEMMLQEEGVIFNDISITVWENGNSWATVSKHNDLDREDVR